MNPRDQRRRAGGRSGWLGLLMTGVLLVGCSNAAGTLTPVPTATSTPPMFSPTEAPTSAPLRQPGATPTATPTPAGTQAPIATATPTPDASPSSPAPAGSDPTSIPAALPVRGLTIGLLLGSEIMMAPRPQGGLYVSIPSTEEDPPLRNGRGPPRSKWTGREGMADPPGRRASSARRRWSRLTARSASSARPAMSPVALSRSTRREGCCRVGRWSSKAEEVGAAVNA